MANTSLDKELTYFIEHQDELVKSYGGKVVVIKDQQVIGSYESDLAALRGALKEHEAGTFLIQRCEPGPAAYTMSYYGFNMKVASA